MPKGIQDLPVETIAQIFVCILSTGASPTFPLVLRLVCTHWRAIAEQTAEIWPGLVSNYGPEWTRRAIELSKTVPLDITLNAQGTTADRLALESVVLAQLPRIRTLALTRRDIDTDIDTLFTQPKPMLTKLAISGNWSHPPLDLKSFNLLRALPPQLTSLSLTRARLSATVFARIPLLMHLDLNSCNVWQSTDEFHSTLARLPQLRTFNWQRPESFNAMRIQYLQPNVQPVEMHNLVHFEVNDTLIVVMTLVARLAFPPTSAITLKMDASDSLYMAGIHLRPILAGVLLLHMQSYFPLAELKDDHSGSGFTELEVLADSENYGVGARWSKPRPHDLESAKLELYLFAEKGWDEQLLKILVYALSRCPGAASSIDRLTFIHKDLCKDDAWLLLLGELRNVTRVTTSDVSAHALHTALTEEDLPRLEQVILENAPAVYDYRSFVEEMENRRKEVGIEH